MRRRRSGGSARTSWTRRPISTAMVERLRAGRPGARGRRGAPRPAARRRDREHVEGGGALARRGFRRGRRFASSRTTSSGDVLGCRARVDARRSPPAEVYRRAGSPVPSVRRSHPVVATGRSGADGVLVSGLPGRNGGRQRVTPPRWPPRLPGHPISCERSARSASARSSSSVPSSRREPTCPSSSRSTRRRAARRSTSTGLSSARSSRRGPSGSARRDDAQAALAALKDEPAAGLFAQAHAGERVGEDEALRRTILVPLLVDDGRGMRRLRLGRCRLRARVRGARALALRRAPDLRSGRAARRV